MYYEFLICICVLYIVNILCERVKRKKQTNKMKSLGIIIYGGENCEHTKKLREELKNIDNIQYIDVDSYLGKRQFEKLESYGTPTLYSNVTKKKYIGNNKIEHLVGSLS